MNKIREFLMGKKTYVLCLALIIVTLVEYFHPELITESTLDTLDMILLGLIGISYRAGVKRDAAASADKTPAQLDATAKKLEAKS